MAQPVPRLPLLPQYPQQAHNQVQKGQQPPNSSKILIIVALIGAAATIIAAIIGGVFLLESKGPEPTPTAISRVTSTATLPASTTSTITPTFTTVPPSPTPFSVATEPPTSSPKPAIVCQSGASTKWSGSNIDTTWTVLNNGDLQNNPSTLLSSFVMPNFCQLPTSDYAVAARIRVVQPYDDFGIRLRYNPQVPNGTSNGYFGAVHTSNFYITKGSVRIGVFDGGQIGSGSTDIDFTQFHTYCFEVQGATLTFFIDGISVLTGSDSLYTQTQVGGVYAEKGTQIEISSFTVQSSC